MVIIRNMLPKTFSSLVNILKIKVSFFWKGLIGYPFSNTTLVNSSLGYGYVRIYNPYSFGDAAIAVHIEINKNVNKFSMLFIDKTQEIYAIKQK